jgi:teichuronic acid biosynthesis glycosyltransferase TuaH
MTEFENSKRHLFVIVSGTPFDGMRRSARGLCDALAVDHQVLFVDPPVSPITNRRTGRSLLAGGVRGLRSEGQTIHRLTPMVLPGKDRRGVDWSTRRLMQSQVAAAIRRIGTPPTMVIQQSPHHSILGAIDAQITVYHASDDFTAGAPLMGLNAKRMAALEDRVAARSDVILAVSPNLVERWSRRHDHVELFPNGVDTNALLASDGPAVNVRLPRPIAVVAGTLSDRIDLALLERVARSASLLLIGPDGFRDSGDRFRSLTRMDSVQWVDTVPFDHLLAYYREADVGLVPYTLTPFNLASFPLKTLEYLAAGLPVVATDLPQVAAIGSPDIVTVDTEEAFVRSLLAAAAGEQGSEAIRRRQVFAEGQSWSRRADRLVELSGI